MQGVIARFAAQSYEKGGEYVVAGWSPSSTIEDRHGSSLPRGVRLGGMGGLGVLIIAVVAMFLGIDPKEFFQGGT